MPVSIHTYIIYEAYIDHTAPPTHQTKPPGIHIPTNAQCVQCTYTTYMLPPKINTTTPNNMVGRYPQPLLSPPPTRPLKGLVSGDPLVDGHVLEQVGLLPEGLGAVLAAKGLLPGVGAEVHLDVGLVEKAPVADLAVVHHLLAQVAVVVVVVVAVEAVAVAVAEAVAACGTGARTPQQGPLEKRR